MDSLRSRPAWIAAAVAAVSMLVVLILLGFVGQVGSSLNAGGGLTSGAVVGALGLLVVGFLGTWWAVRASTPGSSVVPVFLSTWMVLVVATALAVLIPFAMNHGGPHGFDGGAVSGVRWGWIAALLASLAWRSAQAAKTAAAEPEQQPRARGEAGVVPEGGFVMKRASDFPEITLDRKPAAAATAEPDPEVAPDAETAPASEADVDAGPACDAYPAPDAQATETLEPGEPTPYVGKYVTHHDESAPESQEEPPPSRSGGSHRRDLS